MSRNLDLALKIIDARLITEFGLPKPETPGAAGFDVRACGIFPTTVEGKPDFRHRRELTGPVSLHPSEQVYIGCGFAMATEEIGWVGLLMPRSGTGSAKGLVMGNLTGVFDISEYRGEVLACLWNRNLPGRDAVITIEPGDRIGQMVLVPSYAPKWSLVDELPSSRRGASGFGSTGTRESAS